MQPSTHKLAKQVERLFIGTTSASGPQLIAVRLY